MITQETIQKLSLIREITAPTTLVQKFINSDKPSREVSLGKNMKSSKGAFVACQIALSSISENYSEISL